VVVVVVVVVMMMMMMTMGDTGGEGKCDLPQRLSIPVPNHAYNR